MDLPLSVCHTCPIDAVDGTTLTQQEGDSMLTQCEWADAAKDQQGSEFSLHLLPNGPTTRAKLMEVEAMPIDDHQQFRFMFEAGLQGSNADGLYLVSGAGVDESEVFLTINVMGSTVEYQAGFLLRPCFRIIVRID
jgi:hypothetical protein